MQWFTIDSLNQIDTPCLVLYKDRIEKNIDRAATMVKEPGNLRPHVKTNKISEVCLMMMNAGITKFKCATIAEAEMLARLNAVDVLLAYQPVGPKIVRLLNLSKQYPSTNFSCLLDNMVAAVDLSAVFSDAGRQIRVFIDLNTGMNRTGILPSAAYDFLDALVELPGISIEGIHVYDGHLTAPDPELRQEQSDAAFKSISPFIHYFENLLKRLPIVVAGGSATFQTHIKRAVECSPGTFVFWDWGYKQLYPEMPFEIAALVITRIISIVNASLITTDLGYKSVAAENPLPRIHFLNAYDARPVSQSEEHLSLQVPDSTRYKIGEVLYGVPVHICPTVALYDQAIVVQNNKVSGTWNVIARKRALIY